MTPTSASPIVGGNSQSKHYYICGMTELNSIRLALTQLKPELMEKFHISSLGLFGSVVRNDYNSSSDIDIIVEFSQPIGIEFIDLADLIESKLNKSIDLVSRNGVKDKYYKAFESQIIYV